MLHDGSWMGKRCFRCNFIHLITSRVLLTGTWRVYRYQFGLYNYNQSHPTDILRASVCIPFSVSIFSSTLTFTCNTINSETKKDSCKKANSKNESSIWPFVLIFLQNSPALTSEWPQWESRHSEKTDSQLDSHLHPGSQQPPTCTCCCWLLSFLGCSSPPESCDTTQYTEHVRSAYCALLALLKKKNLTAKLNYLNKDLCMYVCKAELSPCELFGCTATLLGFICNIKQQTKTIQESKSDFNVETTLWSDFAVFWGSGHAILRALSKMITQFTVSQCINPNDRATCIVGLADSWNFNTIKMYIWKLVIWGFCFILNSLYVDLTQNKFTRQDHDLTMCA